MSEIAMMIYMYINVNTTYVQSTLYNFLKKRVIKEDIYRA